VPSRVRCALDAGPDVLPVVVGQALGHVLVRRRLHHADIQGTVDASVSNGGVTVARGRGCTRRGAAAGRVVPGSKCSVQRGVEDSVNKGTSLNALIVADTISSEGGGLENRRVCQIGQLAISALIPPTTMQLVIWHRVLEHVGCI
jgi:hypothetical protein